VDDAFSDQLISKIGNIISEKNSLGLQASRPMQSGYSAETIAEQKNSITSAQFSPRVDVQWFVDTQWSDILDLSLSAVLSITVLFVPYKKRKAWLHTVLHINPQYSLKLRESLIPVTIACQLKSVRTDTNCNPKLTW
jgi:hypothetical protein